MSEEEQISEKLLADCQLQGHLGISWVDTIPAESLRNGRHFFTEWFHLLPALGLQHFLTLAGLTKKK